MLKTSPERPQRRTIRPVRSIVFWLMGSIVIGGAAGIAFGVFLAATYDGTFSAASMVGSIYGAVLALPFGLVVGMAMATVRKPRTDEELVGLARRNGVFILAIAGVIGAALWPALVFAAMLGMVAGWAAAPMLVRLTSKPALHRWKPMDRETAFTRRITTPAIDVEQTSTP